MRIALHELKQAGPGASHEVTAEEDFSDLSNEVVRFDRPVSVRVRVVHAGDNMYVGATGETSVALRCDRCLGSYRQDLNFQVGEPFVDEGENSAPEGLSYRNEILDTRDLVREELLLALPVRGLCEETCRGLCPQCGHDLNAGACGCKAETWVGRWAALKQLQDDGHEPP